MRLLQVPVGGELKLVRHVQQARLAKVLSDQLQTDGFTIDQPHGYRHAGKACQVYREGIHILQIHTDRVI